MKRKRGLDSYQKKAKAEGYKSRAAFKIKAIQKKFNIIKKGDVVVDLCGAPGGFSQVINEILGDKGQILLVDIVNVHGVNAVCMKGDITKESVKVEILEKIKDITNKMIVDVVVADCSPNVSGHWATDHSRQIWLAENVLDIACQLQSKHLICKVFMGEFFDEFTDNVKKKYKNVRYYKPQASRRESAEIYLIANIMKETTEYS